jgi:hypothetical protein
MPAPVFSRRSFTMAAVTFAIAFILYNVETGAARMRVSPPKARLRVNLP